MTCYSEDPERCIRSDELWDALREVEDPELPISLVDMGLIVGIRREGAQVHHRLDLHHDGLPGDGDDRGAIYGPDWPPSPASSR